MFGLSIKTWSINMGNKSVNIVWIKKDKSCIPSILRIHELCTDKVHYCIHHFVRWNKKNTVVEKVSTLLQIIL